VYRAGIWSCAETRHGSAGSGVPRNSYRIEKGLALDDLQFSDVIALAAFYPVPKQITEDMLQRAIDYRDAETGAE
jgi:hypothetical protein